MLAVFLSAVVSIGIGLFALSIILREFRGRGAQVLAALMFDERAFTSGDLRPAASRPPRLAPARVQPRPMRRAAA
jgi:hypothetical protein